MTDAKFLLSEEEAGIIIIIMNGSRIQKSMMMIQYRGEFEKRNIIKIDNTNERMKANARMSKIKENEWGK